MNEVLEDLLAWWRDGQPVGMATVVGTWKSAPRPPGATMLVGPDGTAVGSVSGGCVEGAVYELGREVLASGQPRLVRFGVSDDDAFAVGRDRECTRHAQREAAGSGDLARELLERVVRLGHEGPKPTNGVSQIGPAEA